MTRWTGDTPETVLKFVTDGHISRSQRSVVVVNENVYTPSHLPMTLLSTVRVSDARILCKYCFKVTKSYIFFLLVYLCAVDFDVFLCLRPTFVWPKVLCFCPVRASVRASVKDRSQVKKQVLQDL